MISRLSQIEVEVRPIKGLRADKLHSEHVPYVVPADTPDATSFEKIS